MPSATTSERIESPFARRPPRADPGPDGVVAELRAMTGHEEELVERRRGDASTAALCNELLARCLVAPGEEPGPALARVRALPVAARDAALVRLRRLSFGDALRSSVECPRCGASQELAFDLGRLPAVELRAPERVEAEAAGVRAVLRLPVAGDQEAIAAAAPGSAAERRSLLLGRLLVRYGDAEGPFDAAFAHALPVGTRRALEEAVERAAPRLDLEMAVTCVECRHEFAAPFDVASFFLPS